MNIELPAIPAGVLVLLAFFAPYAQALIQKPTWPSRWKKLITVTIAVVLAALVIVFYYAVTGDVILEWPLMVILALMVISASYALVTKPTAAVVEERHGAGAGNG